MGVTVGAAASSFVIVPSACPSASVAPTTLVRFRTKPSSDSATVSPLTDTVTVVLLSPEAMTPSVSTMV